MNTTLKWIYDDDYAANCFFRSALNPPDLKVMLQVTTRCNLHCKHCFLSASDVGTDMSYEFFICYVKEKLIESRVKKVTLTGGEPLLNPYIIDIVSALDRAGIQSCICTNASLISEGMLRQLKGLNIHFNVSLDGISFSSHGYFREIQSHDEFDRVLENIRMIGYYRMLNGILTTPNKFTPMEEYTEMCEFAIEVGAQYLLLNPLSPIGRGHEAAALALSRAEMNSIKSSINAYLCSRGVKGSFSVVYVRFPNDDGKDTASCAAGLIPYIFTNGDIAICPYMVFAADNNDNDYSRSDYIFGSIYENKSIIESVDNYRRSHCFCHSGNKENMGCAAMKIAKNLSLNSADLL